MQQPLPLTINPTCIHCQTNALESLFKPQQGYWEICCQHCGAETKVPAQWPASKLKSPGETTPVDTKDPLYTLAENIREKITFAASQLYVPYLSINSKTETIERTVGRKTLKDFTNDINKMDFTKFIAEARDTVKPIHVPTAELDTETLIQTLGNTLSRCLVVGITRPPNYKMFICIQNCPIIFDASAMLQFAEMKIGAEIEKQISEEQDKIE